MRLFMREASISLLKRREWYDLSSKHLHSLNYHSGSLQYYLDWQSAEPDWPAGKSVKAACSSADGNPGRQLLSGVKPRCELLGMGWISRSRWRNGYRQHLDWEDCTSWTSACHPVSCEYYCFNELSVTDSVRRIT